MAFCRVQFWPLFHEQYHPVSSNSIPQTTTVLTVYYLSDNLYSDDFEKENEVEFVTGTLYGTEHPWFWTVHITALISLGEYRTNHFWFRKIHILNVIPKTEINKFLKKSMINQ